MAGFLSSRFLSLFFVQFSVFFISLVFLVVSMDKSLRA